METYIRLDASLGAAHLAGCSKSTSPPVDFLALDFAMRVKALP